MKKLVLPFLLAIGAFAQAAPTAQAISERLTANALKADVSFLASDAMEGRATPSKSLDIAAEFIASQFRRGGLEPGGDDGYFQTANFASVKPNAEGLELTLNIGGKQFVAGAASMAVAQAGTIAVENAQAVYLPSDAYASIPADQLKGKVVISQTFQAAGALRAGPSLLILINPSRPATNPSAPAPQARAALRDASQPGGIPVLTLQDTSVRDALAASNNAPILVTARVPAPTAEPVKLRNVIGILPGSDPALKDTCLILSAHYDHLGVRAGGEGDRIFNGANDNASSTASLIEIANALAALPERPKRTIVFLAMFGEEIGEIGSLYYVNHPMFPLAKTVADINLEQLGRTDGSDGPKLLQFNMTGFDFTTLAPVLQKAAEEAGVKAVNDAKNGDSYFSRSDNARFANAGVPSTTVSVTYEFPDYHEVGDEWPKLDYPNMAKIDCALALAAFRLANASEAPAWNAANPRAARYVKAREELK